MKNYYEILGITETAVKSEIKRAYFSQVRKYPPDRYEEKFMIIREAYEILSDEKTKAEYDSMHNMSPFIRSNFENAKKYIDEDELDTGIKILEELIKYAPELNVIKVLLGETYRKNNNSGKSIKIFEELVKEEPNNAGFLGHLAYGFLDRGWHKKAIAAFEKAIEIDRDNISFYLGLSDAHYSNNDIKSIRKVLKEAISRFKDGSAENTSVYYQLIQTDIIVNDKEGMINHLDALTKLSEINEDIKDNTAWTLAQLAKYLLSISRAEEAGEIVKRALQMMPDNEEIIKIQEEINNFGAIKRSFELMTKDSRIGDALKCLLEIEVYEDELSPSDLMAKKAMVANIELGILKDFNLYIKQIKILEAYYTELYKIKREFFQAAMNPIKRKKMIKEYRHQKENFQDIMSFVNNNSLFEDEEDEEDYYTEEPFVRTEAKIGRNDPCPCGSGKKYKKCCGKSK